MLVNSKKGTIDSQGIGDYIVDHALTLDMAKQISMVQRNEKGKQIRLYFIECEKRLKNIVPQVHKEIVKDNDLELLKLKVKLEEIKLENRKLDIRENEKVIDFPNILDVSYMVSDKDLAQELNLFSSNNNPHKTLINAIAQHLCSFDVNIKGMKTEYFTTSNEMDQYKGLDVYYSEKGIKRIKQEFNKLSPIIELYKKGDRKGTIKSRKYNIADTNYQIK